MKILIIGNGFDKAHGLKTGYTDFLDWVNNFNTYYNSGIIRPDGAKPKSFEYLETNAPYLLENIKQLMENFWLIHFKMERKTIGDKWVDFEREIERFTKYCYQEIPKEQYMYRINTILQENGYYATKEFNSPKEFFEFLDKELQDFKRLLEIYLYSIANDKELDAIKPIDLFKNLKVNYLISFNYTTTYWHIYSKGRQTIYIHGKAQKNKHTKEGIVLGFDDHYLGKNVVVIEELIPFEKYYQRIINQNNNDYFNLMEQKDKEGNKIEKEIFFYGHSMSPADGDIIKYLITHENTSRTTIYYREDNPEDRANMIKNLAMILGPDELIKRTGGRSQSIFFESVESNGI